MFPRGDYKKHILFVNMAVNPLVTTFGEKQGIPSISCHFFFFGGGEVYKIIQKFKKRLNFFLCSITYKNIELECFMQQF